MHLDTTAKAETVSRNDARTRARVATAADRIDSAARLVAALTIAGTATLVAPPLSAALGAPAGHAAYYVAIVVVAATLGFGRALVAAAVTAAALLRAPLLASGTVAFTDALGVALFVATAIATAAAIARVHRARERTHALAEHARMLARDRDDARDAREALRARMLGQQAWYEAALCTLDEAVVAADVDGRIRFANAAAERLTQRRAALLLGSAIGEALPIRTDADRIDLGPPLRDAIARGRSFAPDETLVLTARDGVERPVHCNVAPVRAHNGGLLGAIVVVRDGARARRLDRERMRLVETARQAEATMVAAQRSLALAERKFAAFMSQLPFPAYIVSRAGAMVHVNEAGRRAHGWREAIAHARTSALGECVVDVPGEARRYVDTRFAIRANDRAWIGGLAFDVTDALCAERDAQQRSDELEALLAHLPIAVWLARGADAGDVRCSAAARMLAGVADDALRRCMRERRPLTGIEREARGDGTTRTFRVTAIPLADAEDSVRGALAFAIDATPLAEYEAVLSRVSAPLR
jgi:PAS domain S-box-containing protein